MRMLTGPVIAVAMLMSACAGERTTSVDLASLSRELQVRLPAGARVLGVHRESGMDDMVRVKFEVSREDFERMLSALPLTPDDFEPGAGRLGIDSGFWNPHATRKLRYSQKSLPEGRAVHVGYADVSEGRVVVFVMNHGT